MSSKEIVRGEHAPSGLDFEIMSLCGEELELNDGTPVPVGKPTEIRTPPL
jgi:hypothetical protein